MYYITGDVHGNSHILSERCEKLKKGDTLIILGDVGANFSSDLKDKIFKKRANALEITMFCIHGNHEIRPETIPSYKIKEWNGGKVYYEEEYPYLLFAIDGEIYNINGQKTMVIGGAYSIDKYYRALRAVLRMPSPPFTAEEYENIIVKMVDSTTQPQNIDKEIQKKADKLIERIPPLLMGWWKDEQPSEEIKKKCEKMLESEKWNVDIMLTHTAPLKFEPTECFLDNIDQGLVDKSTEEWLDKIEEKLNYKKWYAGHYHTDKVVNNKFEFLFNDVKKIE